MISHDGGRFIEFFHCRDSFGANSIRFLLSIAATLMPSPFPLVGFPERVRLDFKIAGCVYETPFDPLDFVFFF